MRHLPKRAKLVILAAATACAATTVTVAVAASTGPARAPHAQAPALIQKDGTLSQSKGIKEVKRVDVGMYCITFKDSRIDPQKIVPQATLTTGIPMDSKVLLSTEPTPNCGNDAGTVVAVTGIDTDRADLAFYFTVA